MKRINVDGVINKLENMGAKKILLQLPDGLKPYVFDYFSRLSEKFSVIISSESFYGACDVGSKEVYQDVDCIVQFGHSEIPNVKYPKPVIFEEYRNETRVEIPEDIFGVLERKGYNRIGLVASVQYLDILSNVGDVLKKAGYIPVTGKQDGRLKYPGQVLGCNFSSVHSIEKQVDCFIVVSTGKFHSVGVQLSTEKEAFVLDLNGMKLESLKEETDAFLKKRYARLSKAKSAKKFCIVVDSKIGQYRKKLANIISNQVNEIGGISVVVTANDVKPSDYENMRCDTVIFTGCPRVPIDDQDKFTMPILTPAEFQSLFGFKENTRYIMDEIVEVDRQN